MAPKLRTKGGKRSRNEASSSEPPAFDSHRFRSLEHSSRFEKIKHRNVIPERNIRVEEDEYPEVFREIARRQWETLTTFPCIGLQELVKEFYANIYFPQAETPTYVSYVRGREVPYDYRTINDLLETRQSWVGDDGHTILINEAPNGPALLQVLCKPGVEWQMNAKNELKKISRTDLLLVPKIWATFVHATILPCSNSSDVTLRRAQLVYSIVTGREVNVGLLISRSINTFAHHEGDSHFGHPHLICLLCERAGVDLDIPGAIPVQKKTPINASYIQQQCMEGLAEPADRPAPAPPAQRRRPSQRSDHLEQSLEQMRLSIEGMRTTQLEMRESQLAMRETQLAARETQLAICQNQRAGRRMMGMMAGMIRDLRDHMPAPPGGFPSFPSDQDMDLHCGWQPYPQDGDDQDS